MLDQTPSEFSIKKKLKELNGLYKNAHPYRTHIKFSKIRNKSYDEMKLLVRDKADSRSYVHRLEEIKDSTAFFQKFEDIGRVHFFDL